MTMTALLNIKSNKFTIGVASDIKCFSMYGMSFVPKFHTKSVIETRNTASHCAACAV